SVRLELEDIPADQYNWEVGGDYEYHLNNGARFKILFIVNENDRSSIRERFVVTQDGEKEKNLFLASASTTQERIVRSSYTTGLSELQDVELGAERAQTILDSRLRLATNSVSGTPSLSHGGLT